MSKRPTTKPPEPTTGQVYLRVAEMARRRGVVTRKGPLADSPNLQAIMRGTGLSYQALYTMLRRPERIQRIDLATLERLCAFFQCEPGELLSIDWDAAPHP